MQPFTSAKFRFWSFMSMILLVFVHSYNLNVRYLQPWTIVEEPLTFTTFTEYLFSNALLRFRIPMLFIISGYLFSLADYKPYGQRTKKRLRTLLVPYLLWSAFGLLLTYVLELFASTRQVVITSGLMRWDNASTLDDYQWWQVLIRWILAPVPFQLWFIRVLLIYNIAYPVIRWLVSKNVWISVAYFLLLIYLWLSTFGIVFLEGEGLLFFSLGVLLQKKNFSLENSPKLLKPLPWLVLFVGLSIIKTYIAFRLNGNSPYWQFVVMTIMHKVIIFSGLVFAWYGTNGLVRFFMNKPWFVYACAFSFIIYALHAPLVTYATDWLFQSLPPGPYNRMLMFILLPVAIILFSIGTGALLRKTVPSFYSLLTGGRGMG